MAADVSDAMLAGDRAKTERLTRIFQDRVAAAIEANFNVAAEDEKVRRRILQSDRYSARKALIENAAARDGELFLYALLTVMKAPWQLIRLGVKAAGSDTAARVADTNYGVAVNIVLAELERMVAELRDDLRSGQGFAVGSLLKTIHDAARGLRTELALPVDSTWGRALAAQRTQISASNGNRINAGACTLTVAATAIAGDPAKFGAGSE
ncbi:MAG: hypothetical protein WA694_18015 [Pseudolabrys sp.]